MPARPDHHNLGGSNRLLNLADAAALLGLPKPRALRDYHKKWGVPSLRVGRELRFRERDLHAWIAKRVA
jgi:predicted DNA-binding transcriptional regulator AlpA